MIFSGGMTLPLTDQLCQHAEKQLASAYQSGTLSAFFTTKPPPLACCLEAALGINRYLVIGVSISSAPSLHANRLLLRCSLLGFLFCCRLLGLCKADGSLQLNCPRPPSPTEPVLPLPLWLWRLSLPSSLPSSPHRLECRMQQRLCAFDECSCSNSRSAAGGVPSSNPTSIAISGAMDLHVRQCCRFRDSVGSRSNMASLA